MKNKLRSFSLNGIYLGKSEERIRKADMFKRELRLLQSIKRKQKREREMIRGEHELERTNHDHHVKEAHRLFQKEQLPLFQSQGK